VKSDPEVVRQKETSIKEGKVWSEFYSIKYYRKVQS